MNLTDQQLMDFDRHLTQLAAEHGIELTREDKNALLLESVNGGFNGDATEAAFAEFAEQYADDFGDDDFEEQAPEEPQPQRDFHADLSHDLVNIQRDLGRKLTGEEIDGIGRRAIEQVHRHDNFDAKGALEEFHKSRGTSADKSNWTRDEWNAFCVARARDMAPEPEPDFDREYDIHTNDVDTEGMSPAEARAARNREAKRSEQDWIEYAALRMKGAEFDDTPAQPAAEEAD